MSAPTPPPTILSTFTQLQGGERQAIAPGAPLVTLGGQATWWEGDVPVTVALPQNASGYGSRWMPDGKSLRVGLGTLDLAARTWHPEPALQSFRQAGRFHVRQVAWFADAAHVAMEIQTQDRSGRATRHEIVVAAADGRVRGRADIGSMTTAMVASADRVLVSASKVMVLDLDAKVLATPDLGISALRVSEGAGMFAATLAAGGVALLRPSDGAIIAKWDVPANDAVPVPHGVVAVDPDGNVRVGCLHGNAIREVAKVASGARLPIVQRVGDRIVVVGRETNPVWVASFANPCR